MSSKDRRKESRMGLSIPVKVQGHTTQGSWEEMTQSDDTSFGGCSFVITHPVQLGHCLHLGLPLPKAFRRYDWTVPSYQVYALVRTIAGTDLGYRVGVMFFGKNAPRGYAESPSMRFLLPSDPKPTPKDRRASGRLDVHLNLKVRRSDGVGAGPTEEQTIAENISKGGARVMTSMQMTKGDIVVVEELEGSFKTRAEIRNFFVGQDKIPRMNLRFLDEELPDRLIGVG